MPWQHIVRPQQGNGECGDQETLDTPGHVPLSPHRAFPLITAVHGLLNRVSKELFDTPPGHDPLSPHSAFPLLPPVHSVASERRAPMENCKSDNEYQPPTTNSSKVCRLRHQPFELAGLRVWGHP